VHVSLRQLKVFEAVARHLSYTRAAEELHLSQPAVSMQVRQLEEEAGLPLFERLGNRIVLTEAGREVYEYGRTINSALQEMEEVLESLKGVSRGRLHLAVASTVNYFAPRLWRSSSSATRGSVCSSTSPIASSWSACCATIRSIWC
jgi:LysR family transcriptional regulator, low CO2-responsive transcriptional regulator